MVVKLLLNIIKKYNLCTNGVNIQFVTHKKDNFYSDEFYTGSILVTPYDKDKKLNYHQVDIFTMLILNYLIKGKHLKTL